MKIFIDQSGKIEQTERDTVLAYCNSIEFTVLIKRHTKRQLQEIYRKAGKPKLFVYQVFAIAIYFLLKDIKQSVNITIDTEYPGRDKIIKETIKLLLNKNKKPAHEINFKRIGNKPKVHYLANDVFNKKKKPNRVLKVEDFVLQIKKADGRLRECFPTLVSVQSRLIKKIVPKKLKKVK